jgi:hypothetical protein
MQKTNYRNLKLKNKPAQETVNSFRNAARREEGHKEIAIKNHL